MKFTAAVTRIRWRRWTGATLLVVALGPAPAWAGRPLDTESWTLAAAVEYRATATWSLLGEVVSALASRGGQDTVVLRAGRTYAVHPRVRLDAGVGFGVTRQSPDVLVTFGVTLALF